MDKVVLLKLAYIGINEENTKLMRTKLLSFLFCVISGISLAQASSSTTFSFKIMLPESASNRYDCFVLANENVNQYSHCYAAFDSVNNTLTVSGQLDYIVGADVLELIIARKGSTQMNEYTQHFETCEYFYVLVGGVDKVKEQVQTIPLNEKKRMVEIREMVTEKERIIQTNYFEFPVTSEQIDQFAGIFMRKWLRLPLRVK